MAVFDNVVLAVWFVGGIGVSLVNLLMFFVLMKNFKLFRKWKSDELKDQADYIAQKVVKGVTEGELP